MVVGTSIIDNAISSLNYAPPTKTVGSFKDGSYGIVYAQDANEMVGRIDFQGGNVTAIAFTAAPNNCSYYFGLYQDVPAPAGGTTFTLQPDGSITFSGQDSGPNAEDPSDPSTWTGTIRFTNTGIAGTLNFALASTASDCAGASVSYDFVGAWMAPPSY